MFRVKSEHREEEEKVAVKPTYKNMAPLALAE